MVLNLEILQSKGPKDFFGSSSSSISLSIFPLWKVEIFLSLLRFNPVDETPLLLFPTETNGERSLLFIKDPSRTRRLHELRYRECYLFVCLIVFVKFVPCFSHERLFDGKTLYAGKELLKETLPLQSGSRVYKLEGLKSNTWYEVKISYPASIPAIFFLQLLKNGVMESKSNHMRKLLNTEKLIFKTERLEEINDKDGLYVLVTVEPEGIVAIRNFKEQSFIIYNIVCEEQILGIPFSSWSVVVLVVFCLVASLILPRFLPSYLLIKTGDRDR